MRQSPLKEVPPPAPEPRVVAVASGMKLDVRTIAIGALIFAAVLWSLTRRK